MTEKPHAVLERLWNDVPVRPVPVEDLVGRGRAARRQQMVTSVLAVGACLLAGGVIAASFYTGDGGTGVAGRPMLVGDFQPIDVQPDPARPGDVLRLSFPESGQRGVAFSMDVWDGSDWRPSYELTSNGGELGWKPSWWSVDDGGEHFVPDIGVGGKGPDEVIVPSTATPAHYRICTANGVDQACGQFQVVE